MNEPQNDDFPQEHTRHTPGQMAEKLPLPTLIRQAQKQHKLFPPPAHVASPVPVVVAVSGGADSVCLLHLLAKMATELGLSLHVAHLDHGLRPESSEDARFVADLARSLGLPFTGKRLPSGGLAQQGGNLEAAARSARLTFLLDVAADLAAQAGPGIAPRVALAHTADDQAETVLMHLLRGSGLDGLAGMRPVTQWPHPSPDPTPSPQYARILRPLLDAQRTQIVRYLSDHDLTWREDFTNQDPSFTRNRLRHEILPQLRAINPNLNATLSRTAHILAGEADRLAQADAAHLADLLTTPAHSQRLVLDLARLCQLDAAAQRGVLRVALNRLLPNDEQSQIEFDHVATLVDALAGHRDAAERRDADEQWGATGPHPITAGLAWTVIAQPNRLCLHQEDALPIMPDHPFLTEEWRAQILPIPGSIVVGGWRLHIDFCTQDQMPDDWGQVHPWEAYLAADDLGEDGLGDLGLAVPKIGQTFAPLGLEGHRKALGDLFTDRKIPRSLRAGWPIILAETGQVAWVCGLQPAHDFRITMTTEKIIHLSWQPDKPPHSGNPDAAPPNTHPPSEKRATPTNNEDTP